MSRALKVSLSNFLQFLTHFEIQTQQMDTQNRKKRMNLLQNFMSLRNSAKSVFLKAKWSQNQNRTCIKTQKTQKKNANFEKVKKRKKTQKTQLAFSGMP